MTVQQVCDGWVHSLKGQHVVFTGRVATSRGWLSQSECARQATMKYRARCTEDFSDRVTLVVHGDLASALVVDPKRQFSQKLVAAKEARRQKRHVHVVDADGFEELLLGRLARCRMLEKHAPPARSAA